MKKITILLFSMTLISFVHAATIYVNVYNVNGNLVQGAYVKLYDSSWNEVSSSYTNSSGMVTFALLDYGTYNYEVYYSGDKQEFWGSEENISLQSPTLTSNFTRYWPYRYDYNLPPVEVYTNNEISFEVTVKNEVSFSRNVKVEIWVDRNQSSPWDFHQTSNAKSISSNSTTSFGFNFTPTSTGTYYWKAHILTWNDGAGDYIATDSYFFNLAFIAVDETGDLSITVKNVNGDNIENALVKLYEEDWDLFEEDYTNNSGEANFDNLDYGTYHYEVYYTGDVLEYWGGDENIVVNNSSESETFNRNWPYRFGYLQPPSNVDVNTPVSYQIEVKNNLSFSRNVKVEIWVDRDQVSTWDFHQISSSQSISSNSTKTYTFNFTPVTSGTYYWKMHVQSYNDGSGDYIVTDSYLWSQAFVAEGNNPFPLNQGIIVYHSYTNYEYAWDSKLFMYDFSTSIKTELSTNWNIDHVMNAHFSPNGSKIVFMGDDSGLPRDWDIYIWDIESSEEPQNLTSNFNTRDEDPKFSPDGNSIVFKQNGDLKIMDLEGNIISEITTDGNLIEESMPYFTTNGQQIVYAKGAGIDSDIYIINTDGGNNRALFSITDLSEYFPVIKDNSSLFFTRWLSTTDSNDQIYLGDFNGNSYSLPINDISSNNSDAYPVLEDYMFFSSTRNGSLGGYDIYFGRISTGEVWSLNDFNINSTLEDLGACFVIPSSTNDYLEVSTTELNLGGDEGSSDAFNISSNTNWNISESTDWFSVSQTQGSGDGEITVTTLDSNKTGSTREGLIVISGDRVQSKEITVYQEPLSISLDVPSLALPTNGSSMTDQTPYLEWVAVNGATDYRLQVDNNNDFSSLELDHTLQENYYQVINSMNYDTYNWRVKASNSTQESNWSDVWTFTITQSSANSDRDALIALYNNTNGTNWTDNTNWLSDTSLNEWYGIVASNERVYYILLRDNNLVGTIPAEIGLLTELRQLNLAENQISGSLPNELGNLSYLNRLTLLDNQLSGGIPSDLFKLTNLEGVWLNYNKLVGQVPGDIGDLVKLRLLFLGNNNFEGKIPIELSNLTNLTGLGLNDNHFYGEIPEELGNLINLTQLHLNDNNFEVYEIPAWIFELTNMEHLVLRGCNFEGAISPNISNLTKLKRIWLNNNSLQGEVPSAIANLEILEYFDISSNNISDLPNLSSLTNLDNINVIENKLTFEDLEPNINIANTFLYSPQSSVAEMIDTTIEVGSSFTMYTLIGGNNNIYQWTKDEIPISGANESSFTINSFSSSDYGSYSCEVTNSIVPDLIIHREPIIVRNLTSFEEKKEIITQFNLYQNYPNPFNPKTKIKYELPKTSNVRLIVYDNLGREVATLLNEQKPAGSYEVEFNASQLSNGVYFYELRAEDFRDVKKIILLK